MIKSVPILLLDLSKLRISIVQTLPAGELIPPSLILVLPPRPQGRAYIPKLEPFSRTRLQRAVKEPPLIEKSANKLADYCSTLEGDNSYTCWRAYFELKDLERESPKKDVEKLILQG